MKYLLSTLAAPLLLLMVVAADETSSRTDDMLGEAQRSLQRRRKTVQRKYGRTSRRTASAPKITE